MAIWMTTERFWPIWSNLTSRKWVTRPPEIENLQNYIQKWRKGAGGGGRNPILWLSHQNWNPILGFGKIPGCVQCHVLHAIRAGFSFARTPSSQMQNRLTHHYLNDRELSFRLTFLKEVNIYLLITSKTKINNWRVELCSPEGSNSRPQRLDDHCDGREWDILEAGQRTDTLRTDLSTDRPTNGIQSKTTTAFDRKSVATGRYGPLPQ